MLYKDNYRNKAACKSFLICLKPVEYLKEKTWVKSNLSEKMKLFKLIVVATLRFQLFFIRFGLYHVNFNSSFSGY